MIQKLYWFSSLLKTLSVINRKIASKLIFFLHNVWWSGNVPIHYLGFRFPAVIIGRCNKSGPSNSKWTAEIVLTYFDWCVQSVSSDLTSIAMIFYCVKLCVPATTKARSHYLAVRSLVFSVNTYRSVSVCRVNTTPCPCHDRFQLLIHTCTCPNHISFHVISLSLAKFVDQFKLKTWFLFYNKVIF
jgi:hypothetical protein